MSIKTTNKFLVVSALIISLILTPSIGEAKTKWPAGSSAKCRDGSYSFSAHRQGTCSHHGGVAVWR